MSPQYFKTVTFGTKLDITKDTYDNVQVIFFQLNRSNNTLPNYLDFLNGSTIKVLNIK